MTIGRLHQKKYVTVLGSCCTGDAVEATGFEAVSTAKLRLLLFQGRTSFLSMTTAGLSREEFDFTKDGQTIPRLDWGFRMATDEAAKQHLRRVMESIELSDALIIDNVSAFVFPTLTDRAGARYFLKSWEWDRFIASEVDLERVPLWEMPIEGSLAALREVLGLLYEKQPGLSVIFHIPQPCFNDGVHFEDPEVTANVAFYEQYCARVYNEAVRHFPRVSTVSPPCPRADPLHPNGPHPFRYDKSYLKAVRLEIERILNL